MGQEKVLLGRKGEEIAKKFLLDNSYQLIDQNFKFKNGEIDLIVKKDEYLVFVEVKARTNTQYGNPEYSITKKKKAAIYRTAEYYLFKKELENVDCRIDVITILFDSNGYFKLNHYINV